MRREREIKNVAIKVMLSQLKLLTENNPFMHIECLINLASDPLQLSEKCKFLIMNPNGYLLCKKPGDINNWGTCDFTSNFYLWYE